MPDYCDAVDLVKPGASNVKGTWPNYSSNNNRSIIDCFLDQVPELAGFWLLTLLLQSPLVLFLLCNESTIITPLERAVTIIMTTFILFEDVFGYFAIRAVVDSQVNKFHLQQFTNIELIEEVPDGSEESDEYYRRHPHAA